MFSLNGWPKTQSGLPIFLMSCIPLQGRQLKMIMPKFRSLQKVMDLKAICSVGIGAIIPKS